MTQTAAGKVFFLILIFYSIHSSVLACRDLSAGRIARPGLLLHLLLSFLLACLALRRQRGVFSGELFPAEGGRIVYTLRALFRRLLLAALAPAPLILPYLADKRSIGAADLLYLFGAGLGFALKGIYLALGLSAALILLVEGARRLLQSLSLSRSGTTRKVKTGRRALPFLSYFVPFHLFMILREVPVRIFCS